MNSCKGSSDRILRVHTLARLLGCSRRTVRRRIALRLIPAMRIGRRAWGVRASDFWATLARSGGHHVAD